MIINIKKIEPAAFIPSSGSRFSAGYDLYACLDSPVTIHPHQTQKVGTGLSIEIPEGYFGAIFARSGLASKSGRLYFFYVYNHGKYLLNSDSVIL